MFTAQFWGKGDEQNLRKVQGLALLVGLAIASAFTFAAVFAPEFIFSIYSEDPAVIALGGSFLRIFGLSFPLVAITFCYANVLRSTGQVKIPVFVSTGALIFNALLSYLLIFGIAGFPELGVPGAAIATLVSRVLEAAILLSIVYSKRLPAALRLVDFSHLNFPFIVNVFKPIIPVILNETFWSLGITAYFVIYARISTESIAAMNIVSSIESTSYVIMNWHFGCLRDHDWEPDRGKEAAAGFQFRDQLSLHQYWDWNCDWLADCPAFPIHPEPL